MGVDYRCRDSEGQDWNTEMTRGYLLGYIATQCGLRGLNPDTLKKSYLHGISDRLDAEGVEGHHIRTAAAHREVQQTLKGFEKLYRKLHPKADGLKLAFGMDLAQNAKRLMVRRGDFRVESKGNHIMQRLLQERVYVCMAVGIYFMLRKSEHLCRKGNRPSDTRRKHLVFTDSGGRVIPYQDVGRRPAQKVTMVVKFSKADASGFGRRPSHTRQEGPEAKELCVVQILEGYICKTREMGVGREDGLYDIPQMGRLTEERLHSIMESTTLELKVYGKGTKATSHSLRYGGATMMAAAGFPQYLIAHYGGWDKDSKALQIYCRPSDESQERVSEFMFRSAQRAPSRAAITDAIAQMASR